jgi:hypothetical protein
MISEFTQHAAERLQQRGVPPLIAGWLLDYGEETFDGRGAVVRYFTRRSIRRMEREFGVAPVKRLSEYLRCYLVQSNDDGSVITIGKRYSGKRIWRN